MKRRIAIGAIGIFAAAAVAHVQEKPEHFSPTGFEQLRAYEQAYPAAPADAVVARASSARYWVFQGVAYRGSQAQGSAWISLGPLSTTAGGASGTGAFSGRVSALAISPACGLTGGCRVWVGTAGGGVWRAEDAMNTSDPQWRWIGQGLGTNSIGSLTIDPNDQSGDTIYVGTGETNTPQNSGAGTGVYRSTDGGDRWTRLSTNILDRVVSPNPIDFTSTRGVSSVAVEPGNPRTIYVGTTTAMQGMTAVRGGQSQVTGLPQPRVGLYKTTDDGATWSLIWVPPLDPVVPADPNAAIGAGPTMSGVRLVKLDPKDPHVVYATAFNNAIHRSAPALEGGDASFKPVFAVVGLQRFSDLAMFDLTVVDRHTRIYVYNGTLDTESQGFYRLDNADVPAARLVHGSGAALTNSESWLSLSSDSLSEPGSTSRALCTSQCFYDLVVATPEGKPDTVVIGGVSSAIFGESTLRSTDAGHSFFGFSLDAQNPANRGHVDVRAVVFHPKDANIAFTGSDGGVIRNDGKFSDVSGARCTSNSPPQCASVRSAIPSRIYFLNKGLQTLQFYNVSPDPRAPLQRLIGGLQDNGTIWTDGTAGGNIWKNLFPFGDGTSASGFNPARSDVSFASFQSNNFFVNFANGDLSRWVEIDDPIHGAAERATITAATGRQFISFDEFNPDTQFTGFQHVWRTKDNGGSQAFLEANCRFSGGRTAAQVCGDWVPLGVAFPFQAGSTPASASRQAGDLTGTTFGGDRSGGIIVATERSALDGGTLWAATSFGRLFVSKNGDAAGPDVVFTRIDTPAVPNRFVTRIVPDRGDVNAAFISYTGFNALTPSTPGHLFRVVFNPSSRTATFTSLDRDLGDLPLNTIAVDDARGDIYAGTDFGPLVLRNGSASWQLAGAGFPEALMVDLRFMRSQRLLIAATHGLGIFYVSLP